MPGLMTFAPLLAPAESLVSLVALRPHLPDGSGVDPSIKMGSDQYLDQKAAPTFILAPQITDSPSSGYTGHLPQIQAPLDLSGPIELSDEEVQDIAWANQSIQFLSHGDQKGIWDNDSLIVAMNGGPVREIMTWAYNGLANRTNSLLDRLKLGFILSVGLMHGQGLADLGLIQKLQQLILNADEPMALRLGVTRALLQLGATKDFLLPDMLITYVEGLNWSQKVEKPTQDMPLGLKLTEDEKQIISRALGSVHAVRQQGSLSLWQGDLLLAAEGGSLHHTIDYYAHLLQDAAKPLPERALALVVLGRSLTYLRTDHSGYNYFGVLTQVLKDPQSPKVLKLLATHLLDEQSNYFEIMGPLFQGADAGFEQLNRIMANGRLYLKELVEKGVVLDRPLYNQAVAVLPKLSLKAQPIDHDYEIKMGDKGAPGLWRGRTLLTALGRGANNYLQAQAALLNDKTKPTEDRLKAAIQLSLALPHVPHLSYVGDALAKNCMMDPDCPPELSEAVFSIMLASKDYWILGVWPPLTHPEMKAFVQKIAMPTPLPTQSEIEILELITHLRADIQIENNGEAIYWAQLKDWFTLHPKNSEEIQQIMNKIESGFREPQAIAFMLLLLEAAVPYNSELGPQLLGLANRLARDESRHPLLAMTATSIEENLIKRYDAASSSLAHSSAQNQALVLEQGAFMTRFSDKLGDWPKIVFPYHGFFWALFGLSSLEPFSVGHILIGATVIGASVLKFNELSADKRKRKSEQAMAEQSRVDVNKSNALRTWAQMLKDMAEKSASLPLRSFRGESAQKVLAQAQPPTIVPNKAAPTPQAKAQSQGPASAPQEDYFKGQRYTQKKVIDYLNGLSRVSKEHIDEFFKLEPALDQVLLFLDKTNEQEILLATKEEAIKKGLVTSMDDLSRLINRPLLKGTPEFYRQKMEAFFFKNCPDFLGTMNPTVFLTLCQIFDSADFVIHLKKYLIEAPGFIKTRQDLCDYVLSDPLKKESHALSVVQAILANKERFLPLFDLDQFLKLDEISYIGWKSAPGASKQAWFLVQRDLTLFYIDINLDKFDLNQLLKIIIKRINFDYEDEINLRRKFKKAGKITSPEAFITQFAVKYNVYMDDAAIITTAEYFDYFLTLKPTKQNVEQLLVAVQKLTPEGDLFKTTKSDLEQKISQYLRNNFI